jgi:2-succinyl-6-hydroxy-2,4-cyclohexadiene-1-carboxylate synthase
MGLATTQWGDGPERLVAVHGFTQTARSWALVSSTLTAVDPTIHVLAPDLPGHGASVTPGVAVGSDVSIDSIADLLVEVAGPATYMGYSMGARCCLAAALRHPDTVKRLIVVSGTAGITVDAERAQRRAADNALATRIIGIGIDAFLEEWLAQPMFRDLPDDRSERSVNSAAGLAASLRAAGTGTQLPSWDRLPTLPMPVLVVAGERDDKFVAIARDLVSGIGANATLSIIAGAGHAAHLEQPQAFVATVHAFLSS